MTMSGDDAMSEARRASARRIEVFTGAGRRRDWGDEQKAAIVAESYARDVSVSDVARRHGLTPSQLFTWRRNARRKSVSIGETEADFFVPAVVEAACASTDEPPTIGFDLEGCKRLGRSRRRCRHGHVDHPRFEGWPVIGPTGAVRVMAATKPVDFRKGAEGLAALVRDTMKADPFSGAVYVFRARRADRIKMIF